MIIAIDGPVATGKSTIAKRLANAIGYIYFDTGAMYRAITYAILKSQIDIENHEQLSTFLSTYSFDVKMRRGERRYFVGEEDVTNLIRMDAVTSHVSRISAHPVIRSQLVEHQRELSKGVNAVFEGRDMGTVVFPDAQLKIYLTGRPEVRAKRRFDELKTKFPEECKDLTLEKALQDIVERDEYDSKRQTSPLKKAEDAFEVDTSDLSIDEVVYRILELKDSRKMKPH